jgi:carbon starvation protein
MAMLVAVTMTASYQKIFDANPRIGFLSQARVIAAQIASGVIPPDRVTAAQRLIFNNRLDAAVTGVLAAMVFALLVEAITVWSGILFTGKQTKLHETPYVATRWAEGD